MSDGRLVTRAFARELVAASIARRYLANERHRDAMRRSVTLTDALSGIRKAAASGDFGVMLRNMMFGGCVPSFEAERNTLAEVLREPPYGFDVEVQADYLVVTWGDEGDTADVLVGVEA